MAYWITKENGTSYLESDTDLHQEWVTMQRKLCDGVNVAYNESCRRLGKEFNFVLKCTMYLMLYTVIFFIAILKFLIPYAYKKLKIRLRDKRWIKVICETTIGYLFLTLAQHLQFTNSFLFLTIQEIGMIIITFSLMRMSSLITILLITCHSFLGIGLQFNHPLVPLISMICAVCISYFLRGYVRVRKDAFIKKVFNYIIDWSDDVLSQWAIFRKLAIKSK